jgi:hypothetical protein
MLRHAKFGGAWETSNAEKRFSDADLLKVPYNSSMTSRTSLRSLCHESSGWKSALQ